MNRNEMNEMKENVFSKTIRAGNKTYFVDLQKNEKGLVVVVKESRKKMNDDGTSFFRNSKVIVYPEDIERFSDAIASVFEEMKARMDGFDFGAFGKRDREREEEKGIA